MSLEKVGNLMRRRHLIVLAVICLVGLGLRLLDLGEESYWLDEVTSVNRASGEMSGILDTRSPDPSPPLYLIILYGWVRAMGTSEWATRILSVIFGVILIPVVYLVASTLMDEKVGILSALMVSLSRFQIWYAQETRMYALLSLTVLASIYLFLRLQREPTRRNMALYVVFTVAMIYTHVYGLFILIFQNLWWVLTCRERLGWRRWAALQAAVLLAYLPWLPSFIYQVFKPETQSWIPTPDLSSLFDTLSTYISGGEWKIVAYSVLIVIGAFTFRKLSGSWSRASPVKSLSTMSWEARLAGPTAHLFLLTWAACAVLIPFTISITVTPVLVTRYTIAASFPVVILAAASARSFTSRHYALAVALLFVGLSVQPLPLYYRNDQKEGWKEAVALLEKAIKPGEPILVNPPGWIEPLLYYYDEDESVAYPFAAKKTPMHWVNRTVVTPEDLAGLLSPGDGFWAIVVYNGGNYPAEFLAEHAEKDGGYAFTEIRLFHYILKDPAG